MDEQKMMDKLINIGIALTSEKRLDNLLEKIVEEARRFTSADAGSLYLKEEDHIHFVVSQNDTIRKRAGEKQEKDSFLPFTMPISNENIAGYVALSGKVINLEDVYNIPLEMPFRFNKSYDERNNYTTRSMLVVPMINNENEIVGVLQLINSMDENGKVIPFKPQYEKLIQSLASQAAAAVQMAQLREELKDSNLEMIERLSIAAEFRDKDTALHIKRMSKYSQIIADGLGFSKEDSEMILFTAPMHDIGKLGVPDSILLKPAKLTAEEFEEMKKHTTYGAKILRDSDHKIIRQAEKIALSHHEKWDGTGYPNGLSGENIPIEGRIVALADVFDALSVKRCYKDALPLDIVEKIIHNDTGTHFDPKVTKAFFENYDRILDVFEKYREED